MRSLLKVRRIGHAGTLDPFATGVLLLCVGRATRLVPWLTKTAKTYIAEVHFGYTTPTDDIEGELSKGEGKLPTKSELEAILPNFIGEIQQIPPQFSAIRIDGKRAYKSARKGKSVDIPERTVRVDEFSVISVELDTDGRVEKAKMHIRCGSGTYIRSLARDMGEVLGSGAYLTALRRTEVGLYNAENGFKMHVERDIDTTEDVISYLQPTELSQIELPILKLDAINALRFQQGQRIAEMEEEDQEELAFHGPEDNLLGVGAIRDGVLHPLVVLA